MSVHLVPGPTARDEWLADGDLEYRGNLGSMPGYLRVLEMADPNGFPYPIKKEVQSLVRYAPEVKIREEPDERWPPIVHRFHDYLQGSAKARMWWHTHHHLRVHHPFPHYYDIIGDTPIVSTWEIANLLLPKSLSFNFDTVVLQAWTEGMKHVDLALLLDASSKDIVELLGDGLERFVADPYMKLLLAAEHMSTFVSGFKDVPPREVMVRVDQILADPYCATINEVMVILASPQFAAAYERARQRRVFRGDRQIPCPVLPKGPWFHSHLVTRTAANRKKQYDVVTCRRAVELWGDEYTSYGEEGWR